MSLDQLTRKHNLLECRTYWGAHTLSECKTCWITHQTGAHNLPEHKCHLYIWWIPVHRCDFCNFLTHQNHHHNHCFHHKPVTQRCISVHQHISRYGPYTCMHLHLIHQHSLVFYYYHTLMICWCTSVHLHISTDHLCSSIFYMSLAIHLIHRCNHNV